MTRRNIRKAWVLSLIGQVIAVFPVLIGPLGFNSMAWAQNPVPLIGQPLVPGAAVPGGPAFTLTVNGTGFVSGSIVQWNGSARVTHFVSGDSLTADIPATDIAKAGTSAVSVVNPGPGGGTSEVVFFPINTSEASVSLVSTDFNAPGGNIYIVTADFNGDGKLDLAATEYNSSSVSVLLGNGDGTFQSLQAYPACRAHGLATGDFNGDGILDLAVADLGCGEVSILLGRADGAFTPGGSFSTGGFATYSVAAGDFNSDGKLDLATANQDTNQASVLLGNGDGTFQNHVDYQTGTDTRQVGTGDFNRDGHLDLAVSSGAGVSILLGNGDGTFQPQTLIGLTTPDNPHFVIADLNGDGKLDLTVANTAGSVTVLLGNGDGSFQSGVLYSTGGFTATVAAADFNGDGILDLATGDYYSANLALLLGNGDGTFRAHVNYPAATGARGLAAADFNGDGRLDIAVANQFETSISVFLQPSLDTTPPAITLAAIPKILLPPDGRMVPVTISGTITDAGSGVNASSAKFAVQDEYHRIQPHGTVTLDAAGNYSFTILLRASRGRSDLNGRKYTIGVNAMDNAGNRAAKWSRVTVPH